MRYSEAAAGRVFVIRLEDGDVVHESIERFAMEQGVTAAGLVIVGGADAGSTLVVGPEEDRASPIVPMEKVLSGAHEVTGTGTLFPDEDGNPTLHMHIACGREGRTTTGCVRRGVRAWNLLEVILWELTDTTASRRIDPGLGFNVLEP